MSDLTLEKTAHALRHLARYHREECGNVDAFSADQLDEWAAAIDGEPPLEPRPRKVPTSADRMREMLAHDPLCLVRAELKIMSNGAMMIVASAPFDDEIEKELSSLILVQLRGVMPQMFGLNDEHRAALQGANQWLHENNGSVEADALCEAFGMPKASE